MKNGFNFKIIALKRDSQPTPIGYVGLGVGDSIHLDRPARDGRRLT